MTTALRIANWDARHESVESRRLRGPLSWVRVPSDAHDLTARRILARPDGLRAYGLLVLLLGVAGRHPAGARGWVISDGEALDAESLALVLGMPAADLVAPLALLLDVGAIELVDAPAGTTGAPADPRRSPQIPADPRRSADRIEERRVEPPLCCPLPSVAANIPPVGGTTDGPVVEQHKETLTKPPATGYVSRHPPTEEQWQEYAASLTPPMPPAEARRARDYYVANGWRVGKNPAKDWKALVRTCHGRWLEQGGTAVQQRKRQEPLLLSPDARDGSW